MVDEEPLLVIYQVEECDDIILSQEINQFMEVKYSQESAAIGELAGRTLQLLSALDSEFVNGVLNLVDIISIGSGLISLIQVAKKLGKKFKLSAKGTAYVSMRENREFLKKYDTSIQMIGPYNIEKPNQLLNELMDIEISGLDGINGVFLGLKYIKNNQVCISWKMYNNAMEEMLAWESYESQK